jgi:hypothetical protein
MTPSFGTCPKTLYKHDVPEDCSLGGILGEISSFYVSQTTCGCRYAEKQVYTHDACLEMRWMGYVCSVRESVLSLFEFVQSAWFGHFAAHRLDYKLSR